jgi:hypothetical protein
LRGTAPQVYFLYLSRRWFPEVEAEAMRTIRQQQDERRRAKLEGVRQQVASGSLVIRKMTDEERAHNPPTDVPPRRRQR